MPRLNRRQFVCGCSAAVASYVGSRFNTIAFADPVANLDRLVVIFLRGGMDGLSLLSPIAGPDRGFYQAARPNLVIPTSGPGAAVPVSAAWGLHPAAAPLKEVFDDGRLAIVQACGMGEVNRSHFDAMNIIELGVPEPVGQTSGWLTRHLQTAPNLPPDMQIESLAMGDIQPVSLLGNYQTVNFAYPQYFNIEGHWNWIDKQRLVLEQMYTSASSWLHTSGAQAISAVRQNQDNVTGDYTPANGAVYPDTDFGDQLKLIARLIKLDLGLQVATIDFGGWDTHEGQSDGPVGYFADLLGELAQGLFAFYADLDVGGSNNYLARTTLTVQSEFGRELRENSDNGTEHGYGSNLLVLGGPVNGGLYGSWPGLHPDQLFEGTDVAVTTDYRNVLSAILVRRLCNPNLAAIFPLWSGYSPLGIVQGSDGLVFADGFETGAAGRWDASAGGS